MKIGGHFLIYQAYFSIHGNTELCTPPKYKMRVSIPPAVAET